MKILHVITTINRGGAENHLFSLVRQQVKQGLTVKIIYLKGDGYWQDAFSQIGVSVEGLSLKYYGQIKPLIKLMQSISQYSPDIIHAHMPPAELYTRLSMKLLRTSSVFLISKHNDEPFYKGHLSQLLGRWVAKKAKKIIAISDSVAEYIQRDLLVDKSKIQTIHYGIDVKPYSEISLKNKNQLRAEWFVDDNIFVVGTVARLAPQKALHVLLAAFAKYRSLSKKKSILVMVGRGPLEGELKGLAAKLGIEKNVLWLGFREDIPAIIKAFDVFALTSRYEGFGLVLLEAIAASTVVVASRVSAIPEIIKNQETGILCEPHSIEEFANAFLKLENQSYRERLANQGFDDAVQNFTLSKMADQMLELYEASLKELK